MTKNIKKIIAGLFVVGLCLAQGTRRSAAQSSCFNTVTQGANTVPIGAYEQSCTTITWSSGIITKDVTYNCCVAAPTIRINGNDWTALLNAGKLEGFRYQKISKDSNGAYILEFKKIVNNAPTLIDAASFN
ncbi:MAG TPA: hypothetical protein VH877_11560 [Polyangia bacterium]|jgi:hypothetical protein|nr:hypothetical protein [Polyangia bacterium]